MQIDVPLILAAHRNGLPLVGYVASWDHTVGKGVIWPGMRRYLVQNEVMRSDLARYHGIGTERVVVTGWPQTDLFHRRRPRAEYEELVEGYGLDPARPLVLVQAIYGGRVSLLIGVTAVAISSTIGVLLGLAAGYFGAKIDWTIMTLINVMLTFPFVLLALAVIAVLGPSLLNMILVLGVAGWPIYARVIRAETMALREREFVVAGRALGMSHARIIFRPDPPQPDLGDHGGRHPADRPGDHPRVVPVVPRAWACSPPPRRGATCSARAGSTCSTRGGSPPSPAPPSSSPRS